MIDKSKIINEYIGLLIKQYFYKKKAREHIKALASEIVDIVEVMDSFHENFDLEEANYQQLDIIAKWVGVTRNIVLGYERTFWGFPDQRFSGNWSDERGNNLAPFRDLNGIKYTPLELDDELLRFFIKIKIIKNNTTSKISGDLGLQEAIRYALMGNAYLVDNRNMTMTIVIDNNFDDNLLRMILEQDLLPRPQGVAYNYKRRNVKGFNFGFRGQPRARGFTDKRGDKKAPFADLIIVKDV